jgi:hypothetical protein
MPDWPYAEAKTAEMENIGKFLVIVGVTMTIVGAALWAGFGRGWLGRLPGDIHVERENFGFYFPIVTCIILSLLLTLLLNIFRR